MRSVLIERSLRRWFEDEFNAPKEYEDGVVIHWAGEIFPDRTMQWIAPRIAGFERIGDTRQGAEQDVCLFQVTSYIKNPPQGDRFGDLSLLNDEARRLMDQSRRATAAKVYDDDNAVIGIVDFQPAQEQRQYGVQVSIGGVTVPDVDLALVTTRGVITRLSTPQPQPLQP